MPHIIHNVGADTDKKDADRLPAPITERKVGALILDVIDHNAAGKSLIPLQDGIGHLGTRLCSEDTLPARILQVRRDARVPCEEGDIPLTDLTELVGNLLIVAKAVIPLVEFAVLYVPFPRIECIHVLLEQLCTRTRL